MFEGLLLAVPNVSEGRHPAIIAALARAFEARPDASEGPSEPSGAGAVRLLDVHSDPDHDRSVFTLVGPPGALAGAVMRGAAVAVREVDVIGRLGAGGPQAGQHPHVGTLDVAPIVYLDVSLRGAACAEALVLADRIGAELEIPVFLYGELTADESSHAGRTRAQLRRGGPRDLAQRMRAGNAQRVERLVPDFGPARLHPSAGAALVAARAPLVAFNVQLAAPATLADARAAAAAVREGGERGLPGVRAIAIQLAGGSAQVSMNVERPFQISLAELVAVLRALVPLASAELVGLAPAAAFEAFPEDLPMPSFDATRQLLENALGS